jgi:hypothetical protein
LAVAHRAKKRAAGSTLAGISRQGSSAKVEGTQTVARDPGESLGIDNGRHAAAICLLRSGGTPRHHRCSEAAIMQERGKVPANEPVATD